MQFLNFADVTLATSLVLIFSGLVLALTRSRSQSLGALGLSVAFLALGAARFFPGSFLPPTGDDSFYFSWGAHLSGFFEGENAQPGRRIWPGKGVWPLAIAVSHLIVEDAVLAPLAMACIAATSTFLILHHATRLIIGYTHPFVLAALLLSQPAFLSWGASLSRESFFWLGSALLVLGFAYYTRDNYLKASLSGATGAVFAIGIRWEVGIPLAYLMLCAAIFYVISRPRDGMTSRPVQKWLVVLPIFAVSTGATLFGFLWASVAARSAPPDVASGWAAPDVEAIFGRVAGLRRWVGRDEVTTAFTVSENPILGVLEGMVRTVFGPFAYEIEMNLVWGIMVMGQLNFLLVLGLAITFILGAGPQPRALTGLAVAALGVIFIIGFSITNYGMVLRFRFAAQVLLIPLAIGGYQFLRHKFRSKHVALS